jgi:hypothetical protein
VLLVPAVSSGDVRNPHAGHLQDADTEDGSVALRMRDLRYTIKIKITRIGRAIARCGVVGVVKHPEWHVQAQATQDAGGFDFERLLQLWSVKICCPISHVTGPSVHIQRVEHAVNTFQSSTFATLELVAATCYTWSNPSRASVSNGSYHGRTDRLRW